MGDKQSGLTKKYKVERVDGKDLKGGMAFVLELGDPNAWPALLTYARTVRAQGCVRLAEDIEAKIDELAGETAAPSELD